MRVLDACCGNKEWWKNRDIADVVFLDILQSAEPSVVGSMTALPFLDSTFDEIYCDPPHLIRNDLGSWRENFLRFGHWKSRREWEESLALMNFEFDRVSTPNAVLHMKILQGEDRRVTRFEDLDRLVFWRMIGFFSRPSKLPWSTCLTLFVDFRKVAP